MNLTLDHYGLHWLEGDIGILVQDRKVDHVLGIQMDFDVAVKLPRKGLVCPHNINLSEAVCVPIPDDPLVTAMTPLPKEFGEPGLFLNDTNENKALVRELLRLSSSRPSEMRPLWASEPQVVASQLQLTNLAPLVLFGYNDFYMHRFQKIVEASFYSPRRLIFLGPWNTVLRPELVRHRPSISVEDIQSLPLEQIGADLLKKQMLRKS